MLDENLDTYRFCRVPFGIICSPFLLAGTIKYHLKQIGTSVALKISDNIYVDTLLKLLCCFGTRLAIFGTMSQRKTER